MPSELLEWGREQLDRLAQSNFPRHLAKVAGGLALAGLTALEVAPHPGLAGPVAEPAPACADPCPTQPSVSVLGKAVTAETSPAPITTVPELPRPNRIQNEPLRSRIEGRLQQVPTLQELGKLFPVHYGDWQRQLDYISQLDKASNVTVDDYHNFTFNDQFKGAFINTPGYKQRITPQLIVLHWTAHRYPAGTEGGQLFATELINNIRGTLSSNYFIPHDGKNVYRYYDEDTHMTAGALGMNLFAVNVEAEADRADQNAPAPSVLYDVKPEEINKMVLTVVQLARRYNLAISEYTTIGHEAGDILCVNSTFNPATRSVTNLRKFDMPQELVHVVINKAKTLDQQLG